MALTWFEQQEKEFMQRLIEGVKRQEKMYDDYLKQLTNPKPRKYNGIIPMIHHDHHYFNTHTLDKNNTLIWKCSCGMTTSSM